MRGLRELLNPLGPLHRCDSVGSGLRLQGRPHVENLGHIEIGRDFSLSSEPVISHLVTGPRGVLRIGHGVSIGHGAAIAAHLHVKLGDRTQLAPFVMILDTDFHEAGNHRSAGASTAIRVGSDVRIGTRVTLLRGADIGDGAQILAGSVVGGRIPAGAIASGVPARVGGASNERTSSVEEVVRRTFGMATPPSLTDGPDQLEGWTSLGALNLLLSLEEAFQVSLRPEEVLGVRSVGDLVHVIDRARER